jgi:hypothetical protein
MQQLTLGTGTAIWWVTEPRCIISFTTFKQVKLHKLDIFFTIIQCFLDFIILKANQHFQFHQFLLHLPYQSCNL